MFLDKKTLLKKWLNPGSQWYGHPHSQNISDMGMPCNPNRNLNQTTKVILACVAGGIVWARD